MTNVFDKHHAASDEADIEQMLLEVGARDEPAPEMMRQAQANVHAQWRAMVEERRRRRRSFAWGIAASFALAVVAATLGLRSLAPDVSPVATVVQVDGQLLASTSNQPWTAQPLGQQLAIDDSLMTNDHSRAALSLGHLSVRLDRNTQATLSAPNRITLTTGALYIDASPEAPATALTVQVQGFLINHLGTQYQVRTQGKDIEISVREGRVTFEHAPPAHSSDGEFGPDGVGQGQAGERIRIAATGEISRDALSPYAQDWQWAAAAAPRFDIDDQSLSTFLAWFARETGREILYASPAVQVMAGQIQLRGSIEGLDLDTALDAVLATTSLRSVQASEGSIRISLAQEPTP